MTRRALVLLAGFALLPAIRYAPVAPAYEPPASRLPKALTGQDFSKLSAELSEPDGYFRSDNLVSNEVFMQRVVPALMKIVKPGRLYLGVGPEQNFTYMAAVKPAMAFIVDIRRGNLQLHLMYKALFELSVDRAEFVSRLFSLRRPAGLGRHSTVEEIFTAYNDPGLRSDEVSSAAGSLRRLEACDFSVFGCSCGGPVANGSCRTHIAAGTRGRAVLSVRPCDRWAQCQARRIR